jgi:hypothetical protein
MAWGESKKWITGAATGKLYQSLLEDATTAPTRNTKR